MNNSKIKSQNLKLMVLGKIFKKKKKEEEKTEPEKLEKERAKEKTISKSGEEKLEVLERKDIKDFEVLIKPLLTEKSSHFMPLNQYVFQVTKKANKNLVRRAVEGLYNVKVKKVRIINVPRKKRKLGRFEGWKPSYKKAIVTLRKEDKIEVMPQ